MNRQYEFVQTVFEPIRTETAYADTYYKHLTETQDQLAKLTASESYSAKLIHASGKKFFGGFFVDRSGIRRPDQIPAGEGWRYTTFWFENARQMEDQLDKLIRCLNEPNYLPKIDKEIKIALNDEQIYYSKIELDLYGNLGMWNFWHKIN